VQQLARLVNGLVAINPKIMPLEKHFIGVTKMGFDHKVLYGEDLRYDFIMCCMTFYTEALKYFFATFAAMQGVARES